MRKYWKFTAIVLVIVLSIGTFYVNSAMSATPYPEFVINKQSGNAEEIKSLILEGNYHEGGSMYYANPNLKITSDGSEYRNNSSLLNQIIGHRAPMIKELQEEYRNFMRGKSNMVDSFFENDQVVAYAEVEYKVGSMSSSDYKFAVSVLNKADGNTTSFTIKVPDSAGLNHIIVEDVQMVDNELKLITQNVIRENQNGKWRNDQYVYTLDLSAQKVSSHETIFSVPEQQDDSYVDARLVRTNTKQAVENLIFVKTQSKIVREENSERMEESSQELIAYNLQTKEKEKLDLPESLKEHQVTYFDGATIYFTKFSDQKLVVTPFNVENKQVDNEFNIPLSGATSNVEPPMIMVNDGKLFVTTHVTNLQAKASPAVINLQSGEILYEGEVIRKTPTKSMKEFELYLHEMSVK